MMTFRLQLHSDSLIAVVLHTHINRRSHNLATTVVLQQGGAQLGGRDALAYHTQRGERSAIGKTALGLMCVALNLSCLAFGVRVFTV